MIWALLACSGGDPPEPTEAPVSDTEPDTDLAVTPTGETAAVPTGDTAPPGEVVDCATIPVRPVSTTQLTGARGYHDVAFTPSGTIIGASTGFTPDLLQADYQGNVSVFSPGMGLVEQLEWLPDGSLAVAHATRGILRVLASGGSSVINGNIRPYGLILGPDQMLYAADQSELWRVDPTTGDAERLLARGALPDGYPRVINFNLDYTRLYIGTYEGSGGRIYVLELDATYTPVGPPALFASGVGAGTYHDTLGVDICGYLYVADYSTSAMYRISPQGNVQTLMEAGGFLASAYGHGMEWGNGVKGWREDAFYITQPDDQNQVTEVVIGVPSRHWTGGTAINLP